MVTDVTASDRRPGASSRRRSRKRVLFEVLSTALASALLLEACFQYLLFSEGPILPGLAERLREPGHYAHRKEDLYWELRAIWLQAEFLDFKPGGHHAELGWVAGPIDPETLRHREDERLAGRRPILLYGDSFARGVGIRAARLQGLCEVSDLADRFCMLNYGTGGYGTDQAFLLLRSSIDHYADRDPVVVFSLFLDDDLDRSILRFRSGPRPQLEPSDDGLVVTAPTPATVRDYLEAHPIRRRSFAWRYLVHGTELLPRPLRERLEGYDAAIDDIRALNRAILAELRDLLRERDVEFFVLLFNGRNSALSDGPWEPHERWLVDALRELEIPFVSTRRDLWRIGRDPDGIARLYVPRGYPGSEHYTVGGNEAAFNAIRRGLAGRFQTADFERTSGDDFEPWTPPLVVPDLASARTSLPSAAARVDRMPGDAAAGELDRIRVQPDRTGPVEIAWELDGTRAYWEAHAVVLSSGGPPAAGPVRVTVYGDEDELLDRVIEPGAAPERLIVSLVGRRSMRLVVTAGSPDVPPAPLNLNRVLFR